MKRTLGIIALAIAVSLPNALAQEKIPGFAPIPAGTFEMGDHHGFVDPKHGGDETPIHTVRLDAFYMGVHDVTTQQYCEFLNSALAKGMIEVREDGVYLAGGSDLLCETRTMSPYSRIGWDGARFAVLDGKENHPIVCIRWPGAAVYCNWLSAQKKLPLCYNTTTWDCDFNKSGFRLSTEAEWEYAARGGLQNPYCSFPWGDEPDATRANWPESKNPFRAGPLPWTTPVGFFNGQTHRKADFGWPGTQESFQTACGANGYGLYDMAGNVWQFINDWYGREYYANSPAENPPGPQHGTLMPDGKPYRGMRGGNWFNGEHGHSRVSNRNPSYWRGPQDPDHPYYHVGFRVVLPVDAEKRPMIKPTPVPEASAKEPGPGVRPARGPGGQDPGDSGPRRDGGGLRLIPRDVEERLNLSDEQRQQIADLERDVRAKLAKILTPEQQRQMDAAWPPRRPGGPDQPDGPGQGPGQPGGRGGQRGEGPDDGGRPGEDQPPPPPSGGQVRREPDRGDDRQGNRPPRDGGGGGRRQMAENKTPTSPNPGQTVGLFLNTPKAFTGYALFAPKHNTVTYLMNNQGRIVQQWKSNYEPGQSAYLLPNGHLLRAGMVKVRGGTGGGEGGRIEEFDWDGKLVWEFEHATRDSQLHHDIKPLPNGHVLALMVERKSREEAIAAGFDPNLLRDDYLVPDAVVEIEPILPKGGRIVWEWHVWDHLIQDHDRTKANYGDVAAHPELIDTACNGRSTPAFWNHMNSIDYSPQLDQIVLSVRGCNEIWFLDHSTTTKEAPGHTGGKHGKGGDLIYRWGNPAAYQRGTERDKQLVQQHDAEWIPDGYPGAGHVTIFNNGYDRGYSSIEEIVPPMDANGHYTIAPGKPYGPEKPVWHYEAKNRTEFFSSEISGTQRLPNGNTLICAGVIGHLFEVTPTGETVWQYVNPMVRGGILAQGEHPGKDVRGHLWNAIFKVHRYAPDYPGLQGRDLTPKGVIELPASEKGKTGLDNMTEQQREDRGPGDRGRGGQRGGDDRDDRPPSEGDGPPDRLPADRPQNP